MYTLLIYDITEDRIRNRVAETCKDYGLQRVQWSAFFGKINHNLREELMMKISRILGDNEGNIQLYPICSKDMKLHQEIARYGAGRL
ncbi:CRISPR-associated endonuclease Cas2 [Selenihalanaerobacter shriftii]|uniref:CRISPR-associated endoribonuclease Cas2 n=1 Tax=Selenihalanaerobacter shriftii TaxID=142842 RepID=A0A1T4PH25_9FIRM|nr:CRISPR-associated endonuclease Cas2 [Selenihalanaerobacter shriftii]SJZ90822.1 CRISPR-associated protein Cas2 [Selenihalanaerobacter shriftii]